MAYRQTTAYPYAVPQQTAAFYPQQQIRQLPQSATYMATMPGYSAYAPVAGFPLQQQAPAYLPGGRVFNGWSGIRQEQEKDQENADTSRAQSSDTGKKAANLTTRIQRSRSTATTRRSRIRIERSECPECERFCRCGTSSCTCSDQEGSCHSECSCSSDNDDDGNDEDGDSDEGEEDQDDRHARSTSATSREQVNYNAADLVHEVAIQPCGSGRVAVHLASTPPRLTVFVVSARRMRAATAVGSGQSRWAAVCHRGTNSCDTTVGDEAAVLGMYWMLRVIHQEDNAGNDGGKVGSQGHNTGSSGSTSGSGQGSSSRSSQVDAGGPAELPARILAYVALFGHQFGVLPVRGIGGRGGQVGPFMLMNGNANRNVNGMSDGHNPHTARLRAQAVSWLYALTSRPRNRRTLEAVSPADWPYLLYTSRALGDRELFGRCVRTLLQRWFVDATGQFCDASGRRVRLDVPDAMRETVARDLASLKSARDRSIEAIVTAAVAAFES